MATLWTAPRTWVVNEVVTAAELNAHVRDNLLELRARHGVSAKPAAAFSVASGVITSIACDAEDYDDANTPWHDLVTNNTRITVPAGYGGALHLGAHLSFDKSAAGTYRVLWLKKNGAGIVAESGAPPWNIGSSFNQTLQLDVEYAAVAGDFYEIQFGHDVGAPINVNVTTRFYARFLGT
jgi:hypothetical protein